MFHYTATGVDSINNMKGLWSKFRSQQRFSFYRLNALDKVTLIGLDRKCTLLLTPPLFLSAQTPLVHSIFLSHFSLLSLSVATAFFTLSSPSLGCSTHFSVTPLVSVFCLPLLFRVSQTSYLYFE